MDWSPSDPIPVVLTREQLIGIGWLVDARTGKNNPTARPAPDDPVIEAARDVLAAALTDHDGTGGDVAVGNAASEAQTGPAQTDVSPPGQVAETAGGQPVADTTAELAALMT
jgi:hypothetical protein